MELISIIGSDVYKNYTELSQAVMSITQIKFIIQCSYRTSFLNYSQGIDGRFMHKQRSCFPKIHFFIPPPSNIFAKMIPNCESYIEFSQHFLFGCYLHLVPDHPINNDTYVGLNSRLDHEIFVRRTRKWRKLRYTNWMKINNWHRLKVNTSFGFLMTLLFGATNY